MRQRLALISLLGFVSATTSLFAQSDDRMSFVCTGANHTMAIRLSTPSFLPGTADGMEIQRRGLFDSTIDQVVKTEKSIPKSTYNPSNPKYKGLEKFALDTNKNENLVQPTFDWKTGKTVDSLDGSQYELLTPPRADLEKIWHSSAEGVVNGTFAAFLQVRYSGGDHFNVIPLACGMNWKP